MRAAALISFLGRAEAVIRVEITRVRGSSPREAGAAMYVSATVCHRNVYGSAVGSHIE